MNTIYALSSGAGRAGVAVVRVSGPGAGVIVEGLTGNLPEPRMAALRTLTARDGRAIDRGLVLWFPAPGSFSGEDMAEFQVHGGAAILELLMAEIAAIGPARLADAGEFTRRAFINQKLDLTAAEGIADLIDAETEAQRKQALRQSTGALAELYQRWHGELLRGLAHFEAAIDFVDEEDLPEDLAGQVSERLSPLREELHRHLQGASAGERLHQGLQVAIVGPPNAGKSTLINHLSRRDVAIVSDIPGTTRDVLEVRCDLNGYPVTFVDTAGLRRSDDQIEQEGVRRARQRAADADLVIAMLPADYRRSDSEFDSYDAWNDSGHTAEVLRVVSKMDLGSTAGSTAEMNNGASSEQQSVDDSAAPPLRISVTTGEGMDVFLETLADRAAKLMDTASGALPTRRRHREGLETCLAHLDQFFTGAETGMPSEILGEDLRLAMRALGRLTGQVDVEDLLDIVFSDFCIGK